jgi:hypothetical protein
VFCWIGLTELFESLFKLALISLATRRSSTSVWRADSSSIDIVSKCSRSTLPRTMIASFLAEKTVSAPLGMQVDGCRDRKVRSTPRASGGKLP